MSFRKINTLAILGLLYSCSHKPVMMDYKRVPASMASGECMAMVSDFFDISIKRSQMKKLLSSNEELMNVADGMHFLWQQSTKHKTRFKPAKGPKGERYTDLNKYLKENQIPEKYHKYFKLNDEGFLEEDIKFIPNRYLSFSNAKENIDGAKVALDEALKIVETPIKSKKHAREVIEQAAEILHQKWLQRNTWAAGDPVYEGKWKDLAFNMKQADIDPLKIVLLRNFGDVANKEQRNLTKALADIEYDIRLEQLASIDENFAVADDMHALWQVSTSHTTRFKNAKDSNGVAYTNLDNYLKDNDIPEALHRYYKLNDEGEILEDIKFIPNRHLSFSNGNENIQGARAAMDEGLRILESQLVSLKQATEILEENAENIHQRWLARNSWAAGNPEYTPAWKELSAEMQQADIDPLKIVVKRTFNDPFSPRHDLIKQALLNIEERILNKKLNSQSELVQVADEIHELWQQTTEHITRFKKILNKDGVAPESIEKHLDNVDIPEEFHKFFKMQDGVPVEDIKFIPNRHLSYGNNNENFLGATSALRQAVKLHATNVSNVDEAKRLIMEACEVIHQDWLKRNTWAAGDPLYDPAWMDLTPAMQLADLNPLKIVLLRNFTDMDKTKHRYYREALLEIEKSLKDKL